MKAKCLFEVDFGVQCLASCKRCLKAGHRISKATELQGTKAMRKFVTG